MARARPWCCAASRTRRPTCTTRLLTLEDAIEFFNVVLGTRLTATEKTDLLAFLRAL
jgi:hypothetical protein